MVGAGFSLDVKLFPGLVVARAVRGRGRARTRHSSRGHGKEQAARSSNNNNTYAYAKLELRPGISYLAHMRPLANRRLQRSRDGPAQ